MMGRKTCVVLLLFLALAFAPVAAVIADDHQTTEYYRVALWEVDRTHWSDFVEFFERRWKPVMEQLLADGVVTEWGIETTALHRPDGYTHATWFATSSYADMDRVWEAMEAHGKKEGLDQAELDAELDRITGKHRDVVLNALRVAATDASLEDAVYFEISMEVKPEKMDVHLAIWDGMIAPVYQKLMDDGVIVAYGLTEEEIVTMSPGERSSWFVVKDSAGIDAVKMAFMEERKDWSKAQGHMWMTTAMSTIDFDKYREYMGHMLHYGRKATK